MSGAECGGVPKDKMCALAKNGKLKKITKLTKHPRFICRKCGRVAECKKNLCKPDAFSL